MRNADSFVPVSHGTCFLRWAGGKKWLSTAIARFSRGISYNRYIEPFLGGGSVFFEVRPENAILGDLNGELINTYKQIRDFPNAVEERLRRMKVSREEFLRIRGSSPRSSLARAARFLYLNRTCFNGLYRTNRDGKFNVPFGGGRNPDCIVGNGRLQNASQILQSARIEALDFEELLSSANDGDLVYCDPAYTVAHGNNGFIRYNERVFSWSDQIRLKNLAVKAAQRGAIVLISNASHESIEKLYNPFKAIKLERSSMMAARGGRGVRAEFLFALARCPSIRRKLSRCITNPCMDEMRLG